MAELMQQQQMGGVASSEEQQAAEARRAKEAEERMALLAAILLPEARERCTLSCCGMAGVNNIHSMSVCVCVQYLGLG